MVKKTGLKKLVAVFAVLAVVAALLPMAAFAANTVSIEQFDISIVDEEIVVNVTGSLSGTEGDITILAIRSGNSNLTSIARPLNLNSVMYINELEATEDNDYTVAKSFKIRETNVTGGYITVFMGGTDAEGCVSQTKALPVVAPSHTPGDIDGSGAVDNYDATVLGRYLSGWDVEVVEAALDVDGSGAVDNYDATVLGRYLSGWDVVIH